MGNMFGCAHFGRNRQNWEIKSFTAKIAKKLRQGRAATTSRSSFARAQPISG